MFVSRQRTYVIPGPYHIGKLYANICHLSLSKSTRTKSCEFALGIVTEFMRRACKTVTKMNTEKWEAFGKALVSFVKQNYIFISIL